MRTKSSSIEGLLGAIEQQKNDRDFNILKDLKMLEQQYTKTSKRDYLQLLRKLIDKYEAEEMATVHAALLKKVQAGDLDAIRLWNDMQKESGSSAAEVSIVDSI